MARTVITPINLTRNGNSALTFTSVAAADDAVITTPEGEKTIILIEGHATNATTVEVEAGTGVQSWMSSAGKASFSVAATTTRVFGPFDSAQFEHADGSITVNVDQPVGIAAVRLP